MSPEPASASLDLTARQNARLVLVTRVLAGLAALGLVASVPSVFQGGRAGAIAALSTALLLALAAVYALVLIAAASGRWTTARRLLFSAWSIYPASMLMLWRPDQTGSGTGELYLATSTAFLAVVLVGFFTLDSWRRAPAWMGVALGMYASAGLFVGVVHAPNPTSFLLAIGVASALIGTLILAGRVLLRDLGEALAHAQARGERAERMQVDLELALDAARGANSAKSRFLANMSHELRTPLTAIIGYVELLHEDPPDDPASLRADLERVRTSAIHLLGLLNAILDLSKVEAGKLEVELGPVNLTELLWELTQTLTPMATQRGNTFTLRTMELPRAVVTDGQKLRQILLNLLSNAVKFTDHGTIELRATADESRLVIDVIDSGAGIPRDQLDRVFEAFERADDEATRRVGGTGLGLAISRRFCELLGGTLTAKSRLGHGSTFTVILPLRPPGG